MSAGAAIAKELMRFAMSKLPDLISSHGDGALGELDKLWQEHKSALSDRETVEPGADLESKAEQVEKNQAEVDARLAERAAVEAASAGKSTKRGRGKRGGS